MGKSLEEVAEGYLTELIHRSLVQVSSIRIDGKAKSCCVHDQIREMILGKFEELNFCMQISEDGKSSLSGIVRRLSVTATSNELMSFVDSSYVRSVLVFTNDDLEIFFKYKIPNFKLLRVFDCNSDSLERVLESLGNFIHLKYLSLGLWINEIPKSFGMLCNLETLYIGGRRVILPKEIRKLGKLRHLTCKELSLFRLEDGIGEMTSLQTLHNVDLDYDVAAKIIKGLGKLKQMRDLRLFDVRREDGVILSSAINEMQHLEKLFVKSGLGKKGSRDVIDLDLISLPTKLRKLTLDGILQMLGNSRLTEDPLKSLNCLQHLLSLSLVLAYNGVCLHFEDGWFKKLKKLNVLRCSELREVIIDKGALPSLKELNFASLSRLENIPTGIQHLEKLEVLRMEYILVQNISTEEWNSVQHVPLVQISDRNGRSIPNPRS